MAKSIDALVKPEMMIWGRETAGLSYVEAARKIGVSIERLVEWESGTKRPTIAQLRNAAKVYKRPTTAFYLSEPPEEPELPHDYRRIDRIEELEYSSGLLLELRKARYRREIAIELLEEMNADIQVLEETASVVDDPDSLASRARGLLNVTTEEQFDWQDEYEALREWKNAVEALGVLVFQTGKYSHIPVKEFRGVSIAEYPLPVILINSADAIRGRIFTLLHEFIHLLLHNSGICDTKYYNNPTTNDEKIEVFCNLVAGAVLVPDDVLLSQDIVLRKGWEKAWTDHELGRLASLFWVSREVILRRLLILKKTTKEFYEEKRAEFRQQYAQRKQPSSGGGPKYYRIILRDNGLAYTRLVLEAYYEGHITSSKVARYLGMKLKHLKDIENEMMIMA